MAIETRGGVPYVRRLSITAARHVRFPSIIKHLQIRNFGGDDCFLFFREEDVDPAPQDHFALIEASPSPPTPGTLWEGPVEAREIWLNVAKSDKADVEIVAYCRRN